MDIRNICLLGHGGSGKTSLVESMLYITGAIDRLGKTADGNTVCDYDPEETKRQISISLAMAPVIYQGVKINVIDTPGNFDFAGEVMSGIRAAEIGVLVCASKDGLSVGAERCFKYLKTANRPCIIYISKEDEENANFSVTFEALKAKFGSSLAPMVIPIWDENNRTIGIIDVLYKKAYRIEGKPGKRVEIPIPENKQKVVDEFYEQLMEAVAEVSEKNMEKYFSGEEFTREEILRGLAIGLREGSVIPVVCGSAYTGLGTEMLLQRIVELAPSPLVTRAIVAENDEGLPVDIMHREDEPTSAIVFKTLSDQYGKYSLVKVESGKITSDMSLYDFQTGKTEKVGRLYTMRGKKTEEVKEIGCGDIGAIAKMEYVRTNDTLCDPKRIVRLHSVPFAEPCYSRAIAPKVRGQEEKVGMGLHRLNEEDPTFTIVNNAETRQMVVNGAGDIQIDVLVSKLKSRFGVDVELDTPRVAYREKIRKQVRKQGRHKKQTGGSGQFGDVHIVFEPQDESEDMIFAEEVFGGSVPKNFFPAVEKGLREACAHGVLAGYPVVFLKATLVDGSYHPVDSSEIAFKTAAQLAYKAALPEASPVLLEPIGELKVRIPDTYMGDIIGDLNKRRGRVMGMTPTGDGDQIVEAEVPMAEMMTYAIDLRSMSQSRGSFTFHFVRYEECPPAAQEKAIAKAKELAEAE